MDAAASSLVVAVVGVAGTLASGLLAHRSALRSKSIELERLTEERREERQAQERREMLEARRVSYATFNQRLRHFHAALYRRYQDLAAAGHDPQPTDVQDARRSLRDAYAEAQMVASDEVLKIGGGVVHLLNSVWGLLDSQQGAQGHSAEALDEAKERLERASEGLYQARQAMRKDLGVTELPLERPPGHGAF